MGWRHHFRSARAFIDRGINEYVILIAGWAWFLVYAYPGYMSYDSTHVLAQARWIEPINDWHPPVMTHMWRILDGIVAGPILMLVLQSVLFLVGMNALLRHVMSPRKAALVAVIFLLLPQNVIVLGVIWKDCQMAGFLMAGIAALFSTKRHWRVIGYLLVFMATAVRYNAAAATFPILVLQFGWGGLMSRWRRYAAGAGVWLGITVAALTVNALLVQKPGHVWATGVAPVDIAGVIRFSPHLDNDQLLADTPGVPWAKTDKIQIRVRTWYRPTNHFLNVTQEPGQIFNYPVTDADRAGMVAAWKKLVFAHPWAFIRHRLAVFWSQLTESNQGYLVYTGFTDVVYNEVLAHKAIHSRWQRRWIEVMEWLGPTIVFQVSLYAVLSLLFLPMCRGNRRALVVIASGLAHMLGLFAVAPAVDYRYAHWMVMCTFVGGALIFATRLKARRESC